MKSKTKIETQTRKKTNPYLVETIREAKKNKNWKEGDRIRDDLKAQGISLIDQAGGEVRWHRS
jgi:cysteinyl-tRNA synthetase